MAPSKKKINHLKILFLDRKTFLTKFFFAQRNDYFLISFLAIVDHFFFNRKSTNSLLRYFLCGFSRANAFFCGYFFSYDFSIVNILFWDLSLKVADVIFFINFGITTKTMMSLTMTNSTDLQIDRRSDRSKSRLIDRSVSRTKLAGRLIGQAHSNDLCLRLG